MSNSIKCIYIENLLSFGRTGSEGLKDFSQWNLFIGENASGKSNVFRLLTMLKKIEANNGKFLDFSFYSQISNAENIGTQFSEKYNLRIETKQFEIIIENGHFIKGLDSINFCEHITSSLDNPIYNSGSNAELLNFSMSFIFQKRITIREDVIEFFVESQKDDFPYTGRGQANKKYWSSGYNSVLNILFRIINSKKNILCIDEPEMNLEPKIQVRLLDIIYWITTKTTLNQKIKDAWNSWDKRESTISFPIKDQIFIASHSPTTINWFQSLKNHSIYEFYRELKSNKTLLHFNNDIREQNDNSYTSTVIKKDNNFFTIYDNLGAKPSDVYQANGIIWVEGPSDVIYIKKWLNLYSTLNNKKELRNSLDFQFVFYGGTLLKFHSVSECETKLIELERVNRRFYMVFDNDLYFKDGQLKDRSNFGKEKIRIKEEINRLSSQKKHVGFWYEEDHNYNTIEKYIPNEMISKVPKSYSKTEAANMLVSNWNNPEIFSLFPNSLYKQIELLYKKIVSWQN